ncbi:MAG: radical SAM protein [Desulfomonile tiedjei]|uniref:Radical SAM protein n=1 Tax=Desulfomonile tiedjei TaxID=2358 RepID=A0A9D6V428_9BACT|nr:radical SAM protein [Desulfomonile tiedjei]
MFEPAYLKTIQEGSFQENITRARDLLKDCRVCPRDCGVNRLKDETGFCGLGADAMVASAHSHYGEETPLVGSAGSGTIFFTSCNLKCIFCQNYEISHLMEGEKVDNTELGRIMLKLQGMGCHNINFVTPSHVVPQILEAVHWAAGNGLRLPLVFNTGGYDKVETLELLDGIVDIYMPDLKFMDPKISKELMDAEDYPQVAQAAIAEMHRQVGDLQINEQGIATRGLLVRHLVMPDDLAETRKAMRFLAGISRNTYVNVMDQYRPCGRAIGRPGVHRSVTRDEYTYALEMAREEGITRLDDRVRPRIRFF